jgi:hypothetical protein
MSTPRRGAHIAPARHSLAAALVAASLLFPSASSAAAQIREVGRGRVQGWSNVAYDVDVAAGYAFVTGNRGVNIFDVRDPARPRRVAVVAIDDGAFGVVAQAGVVYAAAGGLVIADVRDPAHPRVVGTVAGGGPATAVAVCDGIAFVADGDGRLRTANVRNPAQPRLLSRVTVGTRAQGIACGGALVYFADPESGLHVVDVSDPAAPRRIFTVPGTAGAWDVHLVRGRLYLGRHGAGVSVLDLADPRAPRVLGTVTDGGEAYGVSGDSARLFVADLQQGVKWFDVSAPPSIRLVTRLPGYAPHAIRLTGANVYVADQDKGLVVLEVGRATPGRTAARPAPADEYATLVRAYEALPRYAGSREVYRHRQRPMVSQGEPHPPYLLHIYDGPGVLSDVLSFYRRELPSRGWRITENTERRLRATHDELGFSLLVDPSFGFPDRFLERRPPPGVARWGMSIGGVGMEFR